ncbi:disulfide oxidoreductase YuzD [Ammoniphilus resinae]|uniref:Disulfide oxidoreductase YuzD n=2 Tax=Ammoniphilus resinae TaxID=861532 RepID=A0ABS4GWH1_9BACL|nr:DUF1462 family protein [Ammoniphilus resinae]MBP1934611.1 disulfide oxidoreductase YuzD [Ammoniphilus resinae]
MVTIKVYGTDDLCASCINAPSSIETASWLDAALRRVYNGGNFEVVYIDIKEPQTKEDKLFSMRVIEEDLWYPVVVINDLIITEGNPNLKDIYRKLDELGLSRIE